MPLPDGTPTVTVTTSEPMTGPAGTPARGKLLFIGPPLVTVPDLGLTLTGYAEVAEFDATGMASIDLIPCDLASMDPDGWTYEVRSVFTNAPNWVRYILLTSSPSTVRLSDALVPDPVAGTYTVLMDPSALGTAATRNVGTSAGTVAAGDDPRFGSSTPSGTVVAETAFGAPSSAGAASSYSRGDHAHGTPSAPTPGGIGALAAASNLGDLASVAAARGNLGLGSAATQSSAAFDAAGAAAGAQSAAEAYADAGDAATLAAAEAYTDAHSGGGGGSSVRTAETRITTENVALTNAAGWQIVTTSAGGGSVPLKGSIKAAAGDRVRVEPLFMRTGSGFYLDIALLDSNGAISVYAGSKTSSPLPEGNPLYYPQSGSFPAATGPIQFTIGSEHVDGSGMVSAALVCQGAGSETVYASSTYPFVLLFTNLGPEPA
jgi:hypothetical protein